MVKEYCKCEVSKILVEGVFDWADLRDCSYVFATATTQVSIGLFIRLMKSREFANAGSLLNAKAGLSLEERAGNSYCRIGNSERTVPSGCTYLQQLE